MFYEGKSNYVPKPGHENRSYFIGDVNNPVYFCKKGEIQELFSPLFYKVLEIWQYFNLGFGLPNGLPWGDQDPMLMKLLLRLENHYIYNFSNEKQMIDLLRVK